MRSEGEDDGSDQPDQAPPGLVWPWLRVRRAWEHVNSLTELYSEFWDKNLDALDLFWHPHEDGETGDLEMVMSRTENPPTRRMSLLVGEIVYNLRCALDYLVFELALLDSGERNNKSQFPTDEKSDVFWKNHRKTWLRGVNQDHVNMIEQYQPFKGCVWTRVLKEISNTDKHRSVAVVVPMWSTGPFLLSDENLEPVSDDPTKFRVKNVPSVPTLLFDNEEPVIDWLHTLAEQVARVLINFQADFGEEATFTVERQGRRVRYGPNPDDVEEV